MSIGTKIFTWLYGNYVGSDDNNNKYYCNSKEFNNINYKRWVIYKDNIEASKIPSHWHAWLHKSIDIPPLDYKHKYSWQKDHIQNMTGTDEAYFPDSHPLSKNYNKDSIKKEYDPWHP